MEPVHVKTYLAAAASLTLLLSAAAHGAPATTPAATPSANPNWYDVEVIVFRSLDPNAGGEETWPADPGTPDWNTALPLNPPNSTATTVPFQALSPVGEQLTEQWNRLRRSKGYEPVLHVTWTQPIAEQATAPAVRIGVAPSTAPMPVTSPTPTPAAPALTGAAAAAAALQPTPVYGTAKLSTTGPYLHFDLDLVLEGPASKTTIPVSTTINTALMAPAPSVAVTSTTTAQLYRLKHGMRVNGGKAAYFDHPLFGAIVLVTPVRH